MASIEGGHMTRYFKRRAARQAASVSTFRERLLLALVGPGCALLIAVFNGLVRYADDAPRAPAPVVDSTPDRREQLGPRNYPLAADFAIYPLVVDATGRIAFSESKFVRAFRVLCSRRENAQSIRDLLSFADLHHEAVDRLPPELMHCYRDLVDTVGPNTYGSYRQELIEAAEETAEDGHHESVVHRVTDPSQSIVFIANSMGRRVGDAAPADVLGWIRENAESCKLGHCERLGTKTGTRRPDGTLIVEHEESDQSVSFIQYDDRGVIVGIRCVNRRDQESNPIRPGEYDVGSEADQRLTQRSR